MTDDAIDAIIATLQAGLGSGYASIEYGEFRKVLRSPTEIMKEIAYFNSIKSTFHRTSQTFAVFSRE